MKPFPVLHTERLTLRKPTEEDIVPLLELSQDEEVMLYFGVEPYKEEKQAREEVEWFLKIWREGTGTRWVITLNGDGSLVGEIGFYDYKKKHRKAEIGYKLARRHWSKGYMSEAMSAMLGYIYGETDINRIQALVDPRNPASLRVLEKHGFQREGVMRGYEYERGAYVDLIMLSILRREWRTGS
ncbi:GNAT family N-acetyltransferase [Candidatus Bathyarchaeota archaeon]|nr:GNAT family N-acetyltransferase [Candidatus Bathyarchaeota archaeon]